MQLLSSSEELPHAVPSLVLFMFTPKAIHLTTTWTLQDTPTYPITNAFQQVVHNIPPARKDVILRFIHPGSWNWLLWTMNEFLLYFYFALHYDFTTILIHKYPSFKMGFLRILEILLKLTQPGNIQNMYYTFKTRPELATKHLPRTMYIYLC